MKGHFWILTGLLFAHSPASASGAEKLQFSERIEIRVVKARVQFKHCRFAACTSIGAPGGYSVEELKAKVEAAGEIGGSISQLIYDGSEALSHGEVLVAAFAPPIEFESRKLFSANCRLKPEFDSFLRKVAASKKETDYLYPIGDHRQAGCGGFEERNPAAPAKIASGLAKVLK